MHPSIPMSCGMIDFSTTVFWKLGAPDKNREH
jgi:hypothetical protein